MLHHPRGGSFKSVMETPPDRSTSSSCWHFRWPVLWWCVVLSFWAISRTSMRTNSWLVRANFWRFTGFWLVLEWSWYISCMMQVYANCTNKKFHAHTCRILKNLGISRKDTAFSGFLWIPNFRPLHNRCNHVNIIYTYIHISCIWTLEKFTQIIPLHAAGFRTLVLFTLFVHTTIPRYIYI